MFDMRRREFTALFGGTVMGSLVAHAQQPAMPVVGVLSSGTQEGFREFLAAFRAGLRQEGFEEGRNVRIEFRWAEGQYAGLPTLASDLFSLIAVTPFRNATRPMIRSFCCPGRCSKKLAFLDS